MEVARGKRPHIKQNHGFSLIELMVVITIIIIALAMMVPALAPATGRTVEGAARQLASDLEYARQIAISERVKTRVLLPDVNPPESSFGEEFSDLSLRGYAIVSFNRSANTWKQRGKWTRLPQPATLDPAPAIDEAKEEAIIPARRSETTPIDNSGTAPAAKVFTGAYVEFRPNGSTSLDPNSKAQILVVADGIPNGSGKMQTKNADLRYRITIDPLTGSARLK